MEELIKRFYNEKGRRLIVAQKKDGKVYLTVDGENVREADPKDNAENVIAELLLNSKKLNSAILYDDVFLGELVKLGAPVPTVLDDLCQIAGAGVKVCNAWELKDIKKKLFLRDAVIVKGEGALCLGRTLDEANTCCLVLEKGAKSYIEGVILGGVKPISFLEAVLMHVIYVMKYSKKDQSSKLEKLEGGTNE